MINEEVLLKLARDMFNGVGGVLKGAKPSGISMNCPT